MKDNLFQTLLFPETSYRAKAYCAKCGRVLTDPKSIKRGFGPKCWKKIHARSQ